MSVSIEKLEALVRSLRARKGAATKAANDNELAIRVYGRGAYDAYSDALDGEAGQ